MFEYSHQLWESGPVPFSTNQRIAMSCSCADCFLLCTHGSWIFSWPLSDWTVAPLIFSPFLCFSTRGKHTARMASLTSSSWIIDMAKCFGWIGDRDDYLTSFSQYPLQPLLSSGWAEYGGSASKCSISHPGSPKLDEEVASCCSWRGSLPRSRPCVSHLSLSRLFFLQNWSGWSWTGEDEEHPTFLPCHMYPLFAVSFSSPPPKNLFHVLVFHI